MLDLLNRSFLNSGSKLEKIPLGNHKLAYSPALKLLRSHVKVIKCGNYNSLPFPEAQCHDSKLDCTGTSQL